MATKLKNLSITSVDLVDQGANPDAYIQLFKRADPNGDAGQTAGQAGRAGQLGPDAGTQPTEQEKGMFKRFWAWMTKNLNTAEPDAQDVPGYGQPPEGDITKNKKEVTDTMNIDKSRMTAEEKAVLEGFEKKYGIADVPNTGAAGAAGDTATGAGAGIAKAVDPTQVQPQTQTQVQAAQGDVAKNAAGAQTTQPLADTHQEIQNALAQFEELKKQQNAEIEELKKSLEMERLTAVAKKYEVLGKKPGELADKLYVMKSAGGTAYDDYVALLDESLGMVNKSGLFKEIGSNNSGTAGTEATLGIKAAELAKSATGGMSNPESIVKAFEENPELAAQYEAEYMGR